MKSKLFTIALALLVPMAGSAHEFVSSTLITNSTQVIGGTFSHLHCCSPYHFAEGDETWVRNVSSIPNWPRALFMNVNSPPTQILPDPDLPGIFTLDTTAKVYCDVHFMTGDLQYENNGPNRTSNANLMVDNGYCCSFGF